MGSVAAPSPWFARAPHSLAVLPAEALAEAAAARIVACLGDALARRGRAVFAPSAGRTPLPTYARLRAAHRRSLDWSRVICVQLDEYEGVGDRDPVGFAAALRAELVAPLGIDRFHRFHDGDGALRMPLDAYERAIRAVGGIDCAVQGIGRNGHVAFNEPGDAPARATRRVRLAWSTRMANGVLFAHGVTLGLDVLAEARESVVLMTGAAKRHAADALLFRPVGTANPAAALRRCRRVTVFLDPAAAPGRLSRRSEPVDEACPPAPIVLRPGLGRRPRPDDARPPSLPEHGIARPSGPAARGGS